MGVTDWTDLAEGRERWQALVNEVINIGGPSNAGNFSTSRRTFSF
jgi:hypothetical protein